MKNARRQSRELALQALYAWQMSGADPVAEARLDKGAEAVRVALEMAELRQKLNEER